MSVATHPNPFKHQPVELWDIRAEYGLKMSIKTQIEPHVLSTRPALRHLSLSLSDWGTMAYNMNLSEINHGTLRMYGRLFFFFSERQGWHFPSRTYPVYPNSTDAPLRPFYGQLCSLIFSISDLYLFIKIVKIDSVFWRFDDVESYVI